ncbi:hypothetical protein BKP37_12895 [Anaerobacillus alkalilacustris]|uniref:Uncharacterized protein n=1 Tax=Anaerobacillus alkalilacustris TaxID=393763 RepID=A0A1S2LJU5_9BACI|nr:hypothetical protein [Anaerobacillus alkalilacustris]OIJ12691.1 hypothetical protein BKP37_12895 [Anaerobacillus alkalilacustris]
MKEKTLKPFNSINFGRILNAIHSYKKELNGFSKRLFEIMSTKVFNLGKDVELDGMEMEMIVEALVKRGDFLEGKGNSLEAEIFFKLAEQVTLIRVNFQRKNGPKIEKTASAPTLTAIAFKAV